MNINIDFQMNEEISDEIIINSIIRVIKPRRRAIAERQIRHHINKIVSHPGMRSSYIEKIKQLIQLEKEKVKKK